MYHIKPIISTDVPIEYPSSMYKMKSIFADRPNANDKNNLNICNTADQSSNSKMEQLELRQQVILRQLEELKEQLASIKLKVGYKPAKSKQVQSTTTSQNQNLKSVDTANLRDIVINANPKNVPFSLCVLKKLWSNRLSLTIQFYTHSTISSLSQAAIDFQRNCTTNQSSAVPNLNISFIWKNIDNIELVNGSPFPIIGESNILRYLARIGPNEFNYESNGSNCSEIDGQLDFSELLIAAQTSKERQVILKNLNTKLGKNEFFGGASPAINDFSLASAILQCVADKELPPSLLKWSQKVNVFI